MPMADLDVPAGKFMVDPYLDWSKAEGIPVYEDFGLDLLAIETKPWARFGVDGAIVHVKGRGDSMTVFLLDIPASGNTVPQKHIFEAAFYVLAGHGSTVVERYSGERHQFEWGVHSVFAPPLNTKYQFFNSSGREPARIAMSCNLPAVLNLFHNENFVFINPGASRQAHVGNEFPPRRVAVQAARLVGARRWRRAYPTDPGRWSPALPHLGNAGRDLQKGAPSFAGRTHLHHLRRRLFAAVLRGRQGFDACGLATGLGVRAARHDVPSAFQQWHRAGALYRLHARQRALSADGAHAENLRQDRRRREEGRQSDQIPGPGSAGPPNVRRRAGQERLGREDGSTCPGHERVGRRRRTPLSDPERNPHHTRRSRPHLKR